MKLIGKYVFWFGRKNIIDFKLQGISYNMPNSIIGYCFLRGRLSTGEEESYGSITTNIEQTKKIETFEQFLENCGLEKISADMWSNFMVKYKKRGRVL